MAKDTETVTIEVPLNDLGVLAQHDVKMQTDETYRKEALTPPGGYAPGENGKPADPPSGDVPLTSGVVAAAQASA